MLDIIRQMNKQPTSQAAAAWPAVPRLMTRHYMLQVSAPGEQVQGALQAQLRDLIGALVPERTWGVPQDDGRSTLLVVLPDRVVVRHNETVQRQVEAALVDAGLAVPSQRGNRAGAEARPVGFGGGRGGGFFQPQERD
jgi:hypothetical protein